MSFRRWAQVMLATGLAQLWILKTLPNPYNLLISTLAIPIYAISIYKMTHSSIVKVKENDPTN